MIYKLSVLETWAPGTHKTKGSEWELIPLSPGDKYSDPLIECYLLSSEL